MELKDVVGVGQAGLTAVVDEVSKRRDSHTDEAAGPEVAALAESAATDDGSPERGEGADVDPAGLEVKQLIASLATLAAPAVVRATPKVARRGGRGMVMVVLAGAAAGAGYVMWKRRKAAVNAELSGESLFASRSSGPSSTTFERGSADVDSPDVMDPEFARQIDAVADELAEEIVEAVEEPKS